MAANNMANEGKKPALTTISERNQRESPLLRLPPELRNRIFAFALSTEKPYTFTLSYPKSNTWVNGQVLVHASACLDHSNFPNHHLALLLTSRQTHAETAILPLKFNTFSFSSLDGFNGFSMKLTVAQRNAISSVELMTFEGRRWLGDKRRVYKTDLDAIAQHLQSLRHIFVLMTPIERNTRLSLCIADDYDCVEDAAPAEERFRTGETRMRAWLAGICPGVQVEFRRQGGEAKKE